MRVDKKILVGLILLVIGMFLLLEGSKLDPIRGEIVDMAMMGAGAVFVLCYVYLMKGNLRRDSSDRVLMPILLVLGLALVYQAFTRALDAITLALFGSLGAVLAAASAFMLWRRAKR